VLLDSVRRVRPLDFLRPVRIEVFSDSIHHKYIRVNRHVHVFRYLYYGRSIGNAEQVALRYRTYCRQ